jgi:hypothetical protein
MPIQFSGANSMKPGLSVLPVRNSSAKSLLKPIPTIMLYSDCLIKREIKELVEL